MENKKTGYSSIDKPWLKYYSEEAINAPLPECTIYEYLLENNKDHLDEIALVYLDRKITYRELFKTIDTVANAFSGIGVKSGDVVSICSVSTPEIVASIYALSKIGATVNVLEPRNNAERIEYYLKLTESKILIMLDKVFPKIDSIIKNTLIEKVFVVSPTNSAATYIKLLSKLKKQDSCGDGEVYIEWNKFIKKSKQVINEVKYFEEHPAVIVYTGGTTGVPKGVMLSDKALNTVAFQMSKLDTLFVRKKRFLNIMPPFIAYGITCGIHMPLCCGMRVTIVPNFAPENLAKLVLKNKPNSLMGVPSHYEILAKDSRLKGKDLSYLDGCGAGGDAFVPSIEILVNDFLSEHNAPNRISKGYGMTEICSAVSACYSDKNKFGSVGIPFCKNIVGVFDPDTGEEMTYNEKGEICFCSPTMMLGYYKNQEETDKVLKKHKDGKVWVHTNDIGYVDEDGFIFIIGRMKRMIIRADGHNVYPSAIEAVVCQHNAVASCAAVGIKKDENSNGQIAKAFIVLKPEYANQKEVVEKELRELLLKKLPERDQAEEYGFIDELPLTLVGKVDYRALEKKN